MTDTSPEAAPEDTELRDFARLLFETTDNEENDQ
jgi:hypothetical protein